MKRLALLIAVGVLALPGCHRQHYRPDHDPGPPRVINGESETLRAQTTGDR